MNLWSFCELLKKTPAEIQQQYRLTELRMMALASIIQHGKMRAQMKRSQGQRNGNRSASTDVVTPHKPLSQMTMQEQEDYYHSAGMGTGRMMG